MKKKLRIARIWFHGHYGLIRVVRTRICREFIKNIVLTAPDIMKEVARKYDHENYMFLAEYFNLPKIKEDHEII